MYSNGPGSLGVFCLRGMLKIGSRGSAGSVQPRVPHGPIPEAMKHAETGEIFGVWRVETAVPQYDRRRRTIEPVPVIGTIC